MWFKALEKNGRNRFNSSLVRESMAIQCCIEEERTQKVKLKALQTFLLELSMCWFWHKLRSSKQQSHSDIGAMVPVLVNLYQEGA